MKDTRFFRQAELLLQILPFFSGQDIFAVKGGTTINFFIRNLPRLSVDIDLAYLPINDREKAVAEKENLTTNERRFILSVKQKKPQWSLLGIEHARDLPAVKWKMINLRQMNSGKHQKAVKRLQDFLELSF